MYVPHSIANRIQKLKRLLEEETTALIRRNNGKRSIMREMYSKYSRTEDFLNAQLILSIVQNVYNVSIYE